LIGCVLVIVIALAVTLFFRPKPTQLA